MAVYEGMFILDQGKYSRDPGAVAQQIATLVEQANGTMLAARLWDERKLAYPIKGHKKGVYWLTYFRMPGEQLVGLERQCLLTEEILRSLILRVDDRIADALVQHALAGDAGQRRTDAAPGPRAGATSSGRPSPVGTWGRTGGRGRAGPKSCGATGGGCGPRLAVL